MGCLLMQPINIYHNSFQTKEPQLSLGTTATAWSAAPEDIEANIQQVQTNLDNLEIGGRNLLLNTNGIVLNFIVLFKNIAEIM